MSSNFQQITLGSICYRVRLWSTLTPWMGIEAYDWIDSHGWDTMPVRRPGTLMRLYEDLTTTRPSAIRPGASQGENMAVTRETIQAWLNRTVESTHTEATHMLVVCDEYDYSHYPIFVFPDNDFWEIHDSHYGQNMQQVMEVYDLSLSLSFDAQLGEHRANHCPPRKEPQS